MLGVQPMHESPVVFGAPVLICTILKGFLKCCHSPWAVVLLQASRGVNSAPIAWQAGRTDEVLLRD